MNKVIHCINLHKSFKSGELVEPILNDINLSIEKGEFVSIVGPSGSGKSTLLYIMGGLDFPDLGVVKINDVDLSDMNDKQLSVLRRRTLGFVFQSYNLIPNLNVEENILLPILLDGKNTKHYKKDLDEILEIVGLSHRRNHLPSELSGGQQQRVAIARALINNPEIILADEPTGNLDSKTSNEIMALFKKINQLKNITIVQVTHSTDAVNYSSRTIKVIDGKVAYN